MPKKSKNHGEGSITPLEDKSNAKCRKWRICIQLPKTADGKYPQKKKRFTGTYTEAVAEKRRMLNERDNKGAAPLDGTVGELLDAFVEARIASGIFAQRTIENDIDRKEALKFHLADVPAKALTAAHINNAYAELRAGNSRSGRKLSGTTLRGYHKLLKHALKDPMKHGEIDPFLFDEVIAPLDDTKEKKALSNEEVLQLIETLDPTNPYEMALILCFMEGLRQSEPIALEWPDVDFELEALFLRHSLNPDGTIKGTKSGDDVEVLPLFPEVVEALKIRRKAQEKLARAAAGALKDGDPYDEKKYQEVLASFKYVCSDRTEPIKPATFKDWWTNHKERLGLDCTMHELRHTFLTMLARAGVHPRIMQALARHKTIDITMNIYTHINMKDKKEAVQAVTMMLNREKYHKDNPLALAVQSLANALDTINAAQSQLSVIDNPSELQALAASVAFIHGQIAALKRDGAQQDPEMELALVA